MNEVRRARPRIHVIVPIHTASAFRAKGVARRIDQLVSGIVGPLKHDPKLDELHTTVSDATRRSLKRTALVLGMHEGTVLWLLDEFGAEHVNELCRRRQPKDAARTRVDNPNAKR
jgi:hypothetical protein